MSKQMPQLLSTRGKIAAAIAITAFLLALGIRNGLHIGTTPSGWLLPLDFILHGWPLVAVNVAFYGYLWWVGFCFVRNSHGRERIFVLGWATAILLWPLERLRPQWA